MNLSVTAYFIAVKKNAKKKNQEKFKKDGKEKYNKTYND